MSYTRETPQRRRLTLETSIEALTNELKCLPIAQCLTCEHRGAGDHCTKFNAVPPEHIIATGCDEWEYDQIPF